MYTVFTMTPLLHVYCVMCTRELLDNGYAVPPYTQCSVFTMTSLSAGVQMKGYEVAAGEAVPP